MAATGRGGYDMSDGGYQGQMRMCATTTQSPAEAGLMHPGEEQDFDLPELDTDEGSEQSYCDANQSIEAVTFVEKLGNDVNSDSSDTESDEPEQLDQEELWRWEIVEGKARAEDIKRILDDGYFERERYSCARYEKKLGAEPRQNLDLLRQELYEARMENLSLYILRIAILENAIRCQVASTENREAKRSQQWQDNLAANIDYQETLKQDLVKVRKERQDVCADIREIREYDNVAGIDHPRHGELTWSACYTDRCRYHYSSKSDSGYWPSKKTPVYWPEDASKETRKTEKRKYDDWRALVLNPIPGNQSSSTKN